MSPLPPRARQAIATLSPKRARAEVRRAATKWRRRVAGIDHRVVTLEPRGEARGDVLISYIVDALVRPSDAPMPHGHSHFWESAQIARTFVDQGFRVDFTSWRNRAFVPQKPYRVAVDVRLNLERWLPHLPEDCIKIFHGETAHWRYNNQAQAARLEALASRRGVQLLPNKMLEPNRAIESADYGVVLGNDFTLGTYEFAGKPLRSLLISAPLVYPRLDRRFDEARHRFLWFGSGGLVHKGLDLVLETFASLPKLELTVCGPIHQERDFERAYYRELYDLPNVHTLGWVDTASEDFLELARSSVGLLYPSCSEGQCGGVVTCMHAGVIPIVSSFTGVPIAPEYGLELENCELDTLREAVLGVADLDHEDLRRMSDGAREYARAHHTREQFALRYRRTIEELLELEALAS